MKYFIFTCGMWYKHDNASQGVQIQKNNRLIHYFCRTSGHLIASCDAGESFSSTHGSGSKSHSFAVFSHCLVTFKACMGINLFRLSHQQKMGNCMRKCLIPQYKVKGTTCVYVMCMFYLQNKIKLKR